MFNFIRKNFSSALARLVSDNARRNATIDRIMSDIYSDIAREAARGDYSVLINYGDKYRMTIKELAEINSRLHSNGYSTNMYYRYNRIGEYWPVFMRIFWKDIPAKQGD